MKKKELRKEFLAKRKSLSERDFQRKSDQLTEGLLEIVRCAPIDIFHTYLAIEKRREFDSRPFLESIASSHSRLKVVVPRVNAETNELEHIALESETSYQVSSIGIQEPIGGNPVESDAIDFVIVPLICFDRRGHRVGYGGGFYDRFLAKCRPDCLKVGVSFFGPVEEIEDIHEDDVRLDYCVTPDETFCFNDH